jgi:gluconate 2-dehydrogenase gamma chain
MKNQAFTRREFLRIFTVGTASVLISFNTSCRNKISRWRYLNEEEISLLDAIVEQIIPTDDFPGAKWANVSNFIDKQLITYYKQFQSEYRNGLAAFQRSVIQLKSINFESLPFGEQTDFLLKMEGGNISGEYWKDHSASGFFTMLRDHAMQGFYGSPVHGGNRDYISYHMLDLDYPNVIGQNRYTDLSWRIYDPKSVENGK